jgi:TonB family protein
MKRIILVSLGVLIVMAGLVGAVSAQETPRAIRGGILNGKAISLPKPAYPDEARRENASGKVAVDVTIDEQGNVIEAKALSEYKFKGADGVEETTPVHPALQEAAEKAAWGARFSPTKLSGEPVKVSGTIIYNFVSSPLADDKTMPRPVNGGILNGKAVSLPVPSYPETASAVKAGGAVSVQVTIDESGSVISATAVSGHPILRAASVDAAKLAKFAPTLLDGHPVKVMGIVTYNFVP